MNHSLTPFEQLDEVLRYISKKYGEEGQAKYFYKEIRSIIAHIEKIDPSIELSELYRIIEKLIRDGYVEVKEGISKDHDSPIPYYAITFEGALFISEKGGYQQQHRDKLLSDERTSIENRQSRLNQRLLT